MENKNIIKDFTFKKNNLNISQYTKVIFNEDSENEVFYSNGLKLMEYDYSSSTLVDKFSFNNKKIHKFIKIENYFYVLCSDGTIFEYDINDKKITKTFINEEKVLNFIFSKFLNALITINDKNKISILNRDTFIITKQKEVSADAKLGTFTYSSILETDADGRFLITNLKSKLYFVNLLNLDIVCTDFVKPVSTGIFLNDGTYVVGDNAGKLHFITTSEDKKSVISSKHWHAHRVNCLETDITGDYLYSAGEEGVVVIWNLRTEKKTFLPRLNGEINSLSLSKNNQILAINTSDNSIKFVNLFNNLMLTEISGSCIRSTNDAACIANYDEFLLQANRHSGKIQRYNYNKKNLISNSAVLNRNYVSKTEKETINIKELKIVELSNDHTLMLTYEELVDKTYFLNSYLKLWKLNNNKEVFKSELLCIAENPHNNEGLKGIIFDDEDSFVTFSNSSFKYWKIKEDGVCDLVFSGAYRGKEVLSIAVFNNSIYSFHEGGYLVQWNKVEHTISNLFAFSDMSSQVKLKMCNKNLMIFTNKKFIVFDTNQWDIVATHSTNENEIVKIIPNEENNDFYIILRKDIYYTLLKYSKNIFASCTIIKKKNVGFIDYNISKQTFVLLGRGGEIFVSVDKSKKKGFLGKKKEKLKQKIVDESVEGFDQPKRSDRMDMDFDAEDIFEANLNKIRIKK
jgi:WD40 repeat protein